MVVFKREKKIQKRVTFFYDFIIIENELERKKMFFLFCYISTTTNKLLIIKFKVGRRYQQ